LIQETYKHLIIEVLFIFQKNSVITYLLYLLPRGNENEGENDNLLAQGGESSYLGQ